ncbi:MAG: hypothetical protein E7330_06690 [Clostridiales bacterium]|nr:hypothetical protein [Clostridiales bacterium]
MADKKLDLNELLGKAGDLAKKIGADKDLLTNFKKDPVKTLESKLGIDLPDDQVKKLADAILAKLNAEKAGEFLGGLGKMFGK